MIEGLWALAREYIHAANLAVENDKYAKAIDPVRTGRIMVIPLQGVLTAKGSFMGTSLSGFADLVQAAASDDRIGTIILDINSPGGTVYGTPEAADAVFNAGKIKPVIALAHPLTASAAYWIGSQATALYATPSADVGSVGVFALHADFSQALANEGVKPTFIYAGARKIEGNPYEPLDDKARANIQAGVNESYGQFVTAVARGRKVSKDIVRSNFGEGALVSAANAGDMIDGIMTMREVIGKYSVTRSRLDLMRRKAARVSAL